MRIIRIENEADFDSTIKATVAEASGRVFVLLFGTEAPATGQSWCSDCVIGKSTLHDYWSLLFSDSFN